MGITVAVALVAAAIPAASAHAKTRAIETFSISSSTALPANRARSLTLTCPRSAVALHGAPTTQGASDSLPGTSNPRRWTVRFAAQPTKRTAAAVLRCVSLKLPQGVDGAGLVVGTRWSQQVDVPAGMTDGVALKCDRGQLPTGWGIRRGDKPEAQALSVVGAAPTSRGYAFKLENTGSTQASASFHIRCLQRIARGTDHHKLTFQTRIATASGRAQDLTSGSCRPNEFSVSTGILLDPLPDLRLATSYPTGRRGGRWDFVGAGAAASRATTSLICLSTATPFR